MAIGRTNAGGGGAGLNFVVNAYASDLLLPIVGEPNEVAVISALPMGAWIVDGRPPTARADGTPLQTGDVWIESQTTSVSPFFALKATQVSGLVANVIGAHVWNGSSWTPVQCKLFYDNAWIAFSLRIYWEGEENQIPAGGIVLKPNTSHGTATKNPADIRIWTRQNTGTTYSGAVSTANVVDVTQFRNLYMLHTTTGTASARVFGVGNAQFNANIASASHPAGTDVVSALNIAAVSGSYYISVGVAGTWSDSANPGQTTTLIKRVWLE